MSRSVTTSDMHAPPGRINTLIAKDPNRCKLARCDVDIDSGLHLVRTGLRADVRCAGHEWRNGVAREEKDGGNIANARCTSMIPNEIAKTLAGKRSWVVQAHPSPFLYPNNHNDFDVSAAAGTGHRVRSCM